MFQRITGSNIQVFCIIYLTLWCTAPPMGYHWFFRLIAVFSLLTWVIVETQQNKSLFSFPTGVSILTIFYLVYVSVLEFIIDDGVSIIQNIQLYIFFLFLIFNQAHFRRNPKNLLPVLWTILLTFPIWLLRSLIAIFQDPKAMRTIVRSGEAAQSLAEKGVGGYGFVYSLVLLLPCLIYLYKYRRGILINENTNWFSKLVFLNICLSLCVIIFSGYSIAFGLLIISLGSIFFFNKKHVILNLLCMLFSIGFIIWLPKLFMRYYLDLLDLTYGTNYHKKIRDIFYTLQSGEASGTVFDRFERYQRSWHLFLEHPIIGTLSVTEVGKHSEVLDHFAQYGFIIGSIFLGIVLYTTIKMYKKELTGRLSMTIFLSLIFLIFLNNIAFAMAPIVFIIFPLTINLVLSSEKTKKEVEKCFLK